MLKAVLFDFDGTVGNTLPLCIAAFQKAITPLAGRSFSEREIVATFGPSEEGSIRALIPQFYEQGVEGYLHYYRELHSMCPAPFPGIPELLGDPEEMGRRRRPRDRQGSPQLPDIARTIWNRGILRRRRNRFARRPR